MAREGRRASRKEGGSGLRATAGWPALSSARAEPPPQPASQTPSQPASQPGLSPPSPAPAHRPATEQRQRQEQPSRPRPAAQPGGGEGGGSGSSAAHKAGRHEVSTCRGSSQPASQPAPGLCWRRAPVAEGGGRGRRVFFLPFQPPGEVGAPSRSLSPGRSGPRGLPAVAPRGGGGGVHVAPRVAPRRRSQGGGDTRASSTPPSQPGKENFGFFGPPPREVGKSAPPREGRTGRPLGGGSGGSRCLGGGLFLSLVPVRGGCLCLFLLYLGWGADSHCHGEENGVGPPPLPQSNWANYRKRDVESPRD